MPWSNRKYGRVICDACDWASKRKDLTGYRDVLTIGGYLRRKVDPERIYCPQCVLTHADAAGGRDALQMTEVKALEERAFHWLPTEDLAEAQDVAAQDAAEGSWTLAVGSKPSRIVAGSSLVSLPTCSSIVRDLCANLCANCARKK